LPEADRFRRIIFEERLQTVEAVGEQVLPDIEVFALHTLPTPPLKILQAITNDIAGWLLELSPHDAMHRETSQFMDAVGVHAGSSFQTRHHGKFIDGSQASQTFPFAF
jgi:hypothetical protein